MKLFILYYLTLFLCCAYACLRGHKPEYFGAAVIILGSLATSIVAATQQATWVRVEYGVLAIDLIVLLAMIHLTLVSDRYWPMWFTAFHLVSISIHVAVMLSPKIAPWAYATGQGSWAYPMLLALAIGSHEYVRPAEAERPLNR